MMKSIEVSDLAPTGCIMLFHSKLAAAKRKSRTKMDVAAFPALFLVGGGSAESKLIIIRVVRAKNDRLYRTNVTPKPAGIGRLYSGFLIDSSARSRSHLSNTLARNSGKIAVTPWTDQRTAQQAFGIKMAAVFVFGARYAACGDSTTKAIRFDTIDRRVV